VWCTLSCCGASSHIQHGSAVTGGHRVPHSTCCRLQQAYLGTQW
jgi:hypothetical protein